MREDWRIYAKKADFAALAKEFDIDPVVARVIRNRDYITSDDYRTYLFGDMSCLHNPMLLPDIEKALVLLCDALESGTAVKIIGDYDIDGICSVVILYSALSMLGFKVGYDVPDRMKDGYGINKRLIDKAHKEGYGMIVTCDNGIAAFNEIIYAKELGMKVLVTDHHEPPVEEIEGVVKQMIVSADAVVDPKIDGSTYPFSEICGAVVAMKVMQALCLRLGREFDGSLLEYGAIASIGDIMPLRDENRVIVKEGFKKIAHSHHKALMTLIGAVGVDPTRITAYDVGFRIGPCLNSSGRLKNAMYAIDMLLSDDEAKASDIALYLTELNEDRKDMTVDGFNLGCEILERDHPDDKVQVLYIPGIHESVAGIVAGRIKDKYNHPVITFTDSTEEGVIKGSARSIEAYDMFLNLSHHKELFIKFGGHSMAAGISMKKALLDELRSALNSDCELTDADFVKKVWIDSMLPFGYISEKLISDIEKLEPFGFGNSRPVFAEKNVIVKDIRIVGKNMNVAKLKLMGSDGRVYSGVCFDKDAFEKVTIGDSLNMIFRPQINEYNGVRSIEIVVDKIYLKV